MSCKGFIENFATKVVEYSSKCHSCSTRRRLCKNFDDEYDHLDDEILKKRIHSCNLTFCDKYNRDMALTFLHGLIQIPESKDCVRSFVEFMEHNDVKLDFEPHLKCFEEFLPNYLVAVCSFNETYVWLYDDVYDYYKNREHGDPDSWYMLKVLYFKDWLLSF